MLITLVGVWDRGICPANDGGAFRQTLPFPGPVSRKRA
jgi:hypothetical protein